MAFDPMADNLFTMAGWLQQFVPEVPYGVAAKMVRDTYRELLDYPPDGWSFQYGSGQFITYASIQGTCLPIQGSTLVQNVTIGNGISTATVNAGGTSYSNGDLLYLQNGGYGIATVATIGGSGNVLTVTISNPGSNNRTCSGLPTTTNNNGTGCTLNITALGAGGLPADRTTIVGRQCLFGGQSPIISIVDNQNQTSFVLESPYAGITATVAFEITNVYLTPIDQNFERLMVFIDPPNGCQYPFSFTFEEINNIDPQRSASGTPYLLADVDWNTYYLSQLPAGVIDSFGYSNTSTPVPRKELYPRNPSPYNYWYHYKKWQKDLIASADTPLAFFARRGDAIREGALAKLSMWEGPQILGRRANPVVRNVHQSRFNELAQNLQIKDSSIMQRSFTTMLSATKMPYPLAFAGSSFAQLRPQLDSSVGQPFGDMIDY